MRGDDVQQEAMFSYLSPEAGVPQDHPLRPIRNMVNQALAELSGEFQAMYSREGRPSIAPEKLLRALLLQVLYTIRSERLLMEQLDYNLLFRCSWVYPWTTRSGIIPSSPRIGTASSDRTWPQPFRAHQRAGRDSRIAVGRAFHCGWHPD
jgi:transposase